MFANLVLMSFGACATEVTTKVTKDTKKCSLLILRALGALCGFLENGIDPFFQLY